MQLDITKKCADSLRAFSQTNYGIQLKSTHAHELVAAYFGYSSRAALLADTQCPITNLRQAEILVLTPSPLINERCKQLDGLPEHLPQELAEGVYLPLYDESDKWILTMIWPNFDLLARLLADEVLTLKPHFFTDQRVQREGVKTEHFDDGVRLKVFREYVSPYRLLSGLDGTRGVVYIFDLKRLAGHIGYSKAKVSVIEAATLKLAVEQLKFKEPPIFPGEPVESFSHLPFRDLVSDIARKKIWQTSTPSDDYRDYLYSKSADRQEKEVLEKAWKLYKDFLKQKNLFTD